MYLGYNKTCEGNQKSKDFIVVLKQSKYKISAGVDSGLRRIFNYREDEIV